jgi:hypothetical protein
MTEEINPSLDFYPHNVGKTTYEAQRKGRMGDAIGDYLTDEAISAKRTYEEILDEVKSWMDYHEKSYKKSKALYNLLQGESTEDQFIS